MTASCCGSACVKTTGERGTPCSGVQALVLRLLEWGFCSNVVVQDAKL